MPRLRILVTDDIDPEGVQLLAAEPSFEVDEVPTLPAAEFKRRLPDYDAFVGRSATRLPADVLEAAPRLRIVGRAGVGVDNIAMDTATARGIAVINAPAGNTVAVAELVFGGMIALLRHIPRATAGMHAGRWERADLMGRELKGRTLGIVGLGRIGSEVALRAHAFGMKVIAHDPYIAAERFQALRETVFRDPDSFFQMYAHLSDEEAVATARMIWREINGKNLVENIEPTKSRASLILEKGHDHRVTNVQLRRL